MYSNAKEMSAHSISPYITEELNGEGPECLSLIMSIRTSLSWCLTYIAYLVCSVYDGAVLSYSSLEKTPHS